MPLILSVVMVLGMWLGYKLKENTGGNGLFSTGQRGTMQEVMDLVRTKYVDPVKIDSITGIAIDEMLAHLDPHSVYIPPTELKDVLADITGNFQGIGVEFQVFDDTVNIINVLKGGPSEKAGLLVGDKLVKVNDSISLTGKELDISDVRKYLKGPGGSQVKVSLVRNGKLENVNITRGIIPISTIDAAYMITPQIGFIRLNKFGEKAYEEFMKSLETLKGKGMQKLILDLRGNGGGLLDEATDIADEFLEGNKLIVYTKGNKTEKVEHKTKRDGLFEQGKLVVLIDETSASASEVLTGALQDWDRATVIGRRSFGKGLVQQQYNLSNGGALRLTIARYYTPLGRNIQKSYANKSKKEYQNELMQRYHDGEMIIADSNKQVGPAFKTPAGHVVYGGGGITPDIFVPADTTKMDKNAAKLIYKNTLNSFVYKYYLQHQDNLKSIKSAPELAKQFSPGEKEWQALQASAQKDSIQLGSLPTKDKIQLLQKMQALMAKQMFRSEGYFELSNTTDPVVQQALKVLGK